MYQRAELHNHTNESDGDLSPSELVQYACDNRFGILAVTDHNTIASFAEIKSAIQKTNVSFLPGIEVTTLYGHILALGAESVLDISQLNPLHADKFIEMIKEHSQLVGIAHPFCLGEPITCGCRMNLHFINCDCLDYIEIFNNGADDLYQGNFKALTWWEKLIFDGKHIAAVTGKDLHRLPEIRKHPWTTFYERKDDEDTVCGLIRAVKAQRTFATRGPLMRTFIKDEKTYIHIDVDVSESEWSWHYCGRIILVMRTVDATREYVITGNTDIMVPMDMGTVIPEIYINLVCYENLVAVGYSLDS